MATYGPSSCSDQRDLSGDPAESPFPDGSALASGEKPRATLGKTISFQRWSIDHARITSRAALGRTVAAVLALHIGGVSVQTTVWAQESAGKRRPVAVTSAGQSAFPMLEARPAPAEEPDHDDDPREQSRRLLKVLEEKTEETPTRSEDSPEELAGRLERKEAGRAIPAPVARLQFLLDAYAALVGIYEALLVQTAKVGTYYDDILDKADCRPQPAVPHVERAGRHHLRRAVPNRYESMNSRWRQGERRSDQQWSQRTRLFLGVKDILDPLRAVIDRTCG